MIQKSPPQGSSSVGNPPPVQAHLPLDNTEVDFAGHEPGEEYVAQPCESARCTSVCRATLIAIIGTAPRGIGNQTPCQMLVQHLPRLSHMWWTHIPYSNTTHRPTVSARKSGRIIDFVGSKRRGELMAGVRGRDTAPEPAVRRIARRIGLHSCLHREDLLGSPTRMKAPP